MKILNVTVSLNPKGGGWPERTIQMSRALAAAGAECSILTFDEAFAYQVEGVRVETIATGKRGPRLAWEMSFSALDRIRVLVEAADVIHLMGFRSLLNAVVFHYARKAGKTVVICPAGSLPSYGSFVNRLLKSLFDLFAGNAMTKGVSGCIAVTQKEKMALIAHGFDAKRTYVMPNAVFGADFAAEDNSGFRAHYGLGEVRFILFLGRLAHIKGPDLLLQAFAGLPSGMNHLHLVFAGPDAGMQKALENMAHERGISGRTHFIGHIGQPDKSHAYHAADIVVVPSRQEAMSIVALEAGIAGTTVVITDACGFDELAEIDPRLVTEASIEGLRDSLTGLLNDSGLEQIGASLMQWIKNDYSWGAMAAHYLQLYRSLSGAEQ